MALIEVRNLVKKFDDHTVLNGVNLELLQGELKVVMGPSGCGKSTLLRCLNRLVEPTSGTISFRGTDITSSSTDVLALRQSIGFVFQQFALYRHLTVGDNVTHDLLFARQISEKVIFLDQGVVRAEDTIERLATNHPDAKVREFFGREGHAS